MTKESEVICIMCPLACRIAVNIDAAGNILNVANNQCKRGEEFAIGEVKFPGRILTTTIITENSVHNLLPAKTDKPISKNLLMECMCYLSQVVVKPPVKAGQIIVNNILNTGADLVSTDDLLA
jgi:CxxC motif-containing protein